MYNFKSFSATSSNRIPAAIMVPTGILLYILSLLTFVGNAMVLHAIRTDKRLQTVSLNTNTVFCLALSKLNRSLEVKCVVTTTNNQESIQRLEVCLLAFKTRLSARFVQFPKVLAFYLGDTTLFYSSTLPKWEVFPSQIALKGFIKVL